MRIAVNLDTGAITSWTIQTLTGTKLKRRDQVPVEVKFHRGGNFEQLPDAATGKLGIKLPGSAGFLAFVSGWTKTGTGKDAVYTFPLNLNTVAIGDAFPEGVTEISARLEVERSAPGLRRSSATLSLMIEDDLITGEEPEPIPGPPALSGWGNDKFRFGATGEPEFFIEGLGWIRLNAVGNPPQLQFSLI